MYTKAIWRPIGVGRIDLFDLVLESPEAADVGTEQFISVRSARVRKTIAQNERLTEKRLSAIVASEAVTFGVPTSGSFHSHVPLSGFNDMSTGEAEVGVNYVVALGAVRLPANVTVVAGDDVSLAG